MCDYTVTRAVNLSIFFFFGRHCMTDPSLLKTNKGTKLSNLYLKHFIPSHFIDEHVN